MQNADAGDQQAPQDKHLIRCLCGGDNVASQGLVVDFFPDWLKMVGKKLLRTYGDLVFYRDDLEEHIYGPNGPQKMQRRKGFEKIHPLKHNKITWLK